MYILHTAHDYERQDVWAHDLACFQAQTHVYVTTSSNKPLNATTDHSVAAGTYTLVHWTTQLGLSLIYADIYIYFCLCKVVQ